MTRKRGIAVFLFLIGLVFLVDELWMFGFPIGHILPDLSEFHIAPFGFQYHHWMTGIILVVLSMAIWRHDTKRK
jgi:hypothetical protein